MLESSAPMALGDSLVLSGIGILVVFMELAILAVLIVVISKVVRGIEGKGAPVPAAASASAAPAPVPAAPAAASVPAVPPTGLTLTDITEPAAAAVMALVSDQSGIPLNHLAFHSIKGVVALDGIEERDAAVVMALTAHQMNVPLENLIFKSIKKV